MDPNLSAKPQPRRKTLIRENPQNPRNPRPMSSDSPGAMLMVIPCSGGPSLVWTGRAFTDGRSTSHKQKMAFFEGFL